MNGAGKYIIGGIIILLLVAALIWYINKEKKPTFGATAGNQPTNAEKRVFLANSIGLSGTEAAKMLKMTDAEINDVYEFYTKYDFKGTALVEPLRSRIGAISVKYNIFT